MKSNVIWLTGISGSGKTTIGTRLVEYFKQSNKKVVFLDGDQVRTFFEGDLGYTKEDRVLNVKRIAFAAHLLAENGVHVIVSNIAPYFEVRDFIRTKLGDKYIQIFLDADLKTVRKRDVKGLYANFLNNKIDNLIGEDDKYETPRNPSLIIKTGNESVEISVHKILSFLGSIDVIEYKGN